MNKPKEDKKVPSWLKRIQEGSWEPEILISGIVLYGLFQIPALIDAFYVYLKNYSYALIAAGGFSLTLSSLLKISIVWLITGFISHLFFRSVWAAFIGLSYVYTDGINPDKLNYTPLFKRHLNLNTDFKDQIIKLEKICSTIFSVSFLIFMWVIGLSFAMIIIVGILVIYTKINPDGLLGNNFIDIIIQFVIFIALIDLVTLGGLKRIPYFRKIYYPFYRLIGWLTLSFLYRNIYYGFASNHKKWKVISALGIYVSLTIFGSFYFRGDSIKPLNDIGLKPALSAASVLNPSEYLNLAEKYSNQIHIPSDRINGQTLEVFVVHSSSLEDIFIKPGCNYDSLINTDSLETSSAKLKCLKNFYHLELNDNKIDGKYFYMSNPLTRQDGLKTYLDISDLEKGYHELSLYYNFYDEEGDSTYLSYQTTVEFYKASPRVKQEIYTLNLLDSSYNNNSMADSKELKSTYPNEK